MVSKAREVILGYRESPENIEDLDPDTTRITHLLSSATSYSSPFRGLCSLQSLRCYTILDLDIFESRLPGVTRVLKGDEFPPSIECLRINLSKLDASLLPPKLLRLEISAVRGAEVLEISGRFPSSLQVLTIKCVNLTSGLDHFSEDSRLQEIILQGVGVFPNTTLAHLPRSVKKVSLIDLYRGPLYVVDCPPLLETLIVIKSDAVIHEYMVLPPLLRDVEIGVRWIDRLPDSVESLELAEYCDDVIAINRLPSGLRSLTLKKGVIARGIHIPPFLNISDPQYRSRALTSNHIPISGTLFGPPNWFPIILLELLHFRPLYDCCAKSQKLYRDFICRKFGYGMQRNMVAKLLDVASFFVFKLAHQNNQLPSDVFTVIKSFL